MKLLPLEAFLDACGARRPLCLDVTPPDGQPVQRHVLNQPFALLGRYECADVRLNDPGVSRRHALIQRIGGRPFCLDLGTRTGTHWDQGTDGRGWITGPGPVRVRHFHVQVVEEGADQTPSLPCHDPSANGSLAECGLPAAILDVVNHGRWVCSWRINRLLAIVGTDAGCKVRLNGPQIGRFHCALVCTSRGIWAVDLRRQHGLVVNGTPVRYGLLEEGDKLQVGSFTIRLRYETLEAAAAESVTRAQTQPTMPRLNGTALAPQHASLPALVNGMPALSAAASAGLVLHAPTSTALTAGDHANADLLPRVLQQFSEMQHQMFDQSLLMMFQMFRTMHGDHVEGLREQLARMDELNRELQDLLAQRMKLAPTAPTPTGADKLLAAAPTAPVERKPATAPAAEGKDQAAAPVRGFTPPPADPAKTRPVDPATAAAAPDIHLWLCQRMETIQEERQGLWQRIVGSLRKQD